jgi:hypothetical protein
MAHKIEIRVPSLHTPPIYTALGWQVLPLNSDHHILFFQEANLSHGKPVDYRNKSINIQIQKPHLSRCQSGKGSSTGTRKTL